MKFSSQRSHAKQFLWISLTIVLTVSTIVLFLQNIGYRGKLICAQEQQKILIGQIENLKISLTEAERLLEAQPGLFSWEIERLKKKGLKDPVKDIIADLMKHKELIPYEGILGGTMGFYDERCIHILTPKWVLACFDDGHMVGHMLLEYRVSDNGRIFWKVIDSYLDHSLDY